MNLRAEREIEVVLGHLEYRNAILLAMVRKLGVDLDHLVDDAAGEKTP